MSGFVRRAQRKVAKLESELEAARIELARQLELDVQRNAMREKILEEKKEERRAAQRARYAENPELEKTKHMILLQGICIKHSIRCDDSTITEFQTWKRATSFELGTTLYQKAVQFVEIMKQKESAESIPVFAKTMTGDLIPLEYHAEKDAQDLLRQLAEFDPEMYPIGSTAIVRAEEFAGMPVEKSEIFFIWQHGAQLVSYHPKIERVFEIHYSSNTSECVIEYEFKIMPGSIVMQSPGSYKATRLNNIEYFRLLYYPQSDRISNIWSQSRAPRSEMRDTVVELAIDFEYAPGGGMLPYTLIKQAQEELCTIFEIIRRNKTF